MPFNSNFFLSANQQAQLHKLNAEREKEEEKIESELLQDLSPEFEKSTHEIDRSMPGFNLPLKIKNADDYACTVNTYLKAYFNQMERTPALSRIQNLLSDTSKTIEHICKAIDYERDGNTTIAKNHIMEILKECLRSPFFVSDLDKSYAFRGIAPYRELWPSMVDESFYYKQMHNPLTFFRCRIDNGKDNIKSIKDMLHVPLNQLSKVSAGRYNLPGVPCLYLATTTYCCWKELSRPQKMFVSAFKPTDTGKKLRILNMVFPNSLIHGIDYNPYGKMSSLSYDMRRLFPLVLASTVSVESTETNQGEDSHNKLEYTITNLIMQCLQELHIDGVAYITTKNSTEFQFPHGINLALPVFDTPVSTYGKICAKFELTSPELFDHENVDHRTMSNLKTRSYINSVKWTEFTDFADSCKGQGRCSYNDTPFSIIDDRVVNNLYYSAAPLVP